MIRRFVRQNKSNPFCNLITAGPSVCVLPEVSHKLVKRISKSSSIVISLKPKAYIESAVDKKSITIKRKAKQILNQLYWEESNFENTAALCNHDGTKINTNKSKVKDAIKTLLGKILEPENRDNVFSLGEREWLTDFALHSCIKSVTPSQSGDQYSIMYPMPFEVLAEIFNSESRAFQKVADEKQLYCSVE